MSLQNIQAEFAESILNTDGNLNGDLSISPASHLRIYQHNMQTTLLQTLATTYPLVSKLVGDDFFHMMAHEYMRCYPSCSGNLYDYGEYFSDFLLEYEPVKNLIYLHEVAQFEWICHSIFIAADHPALDPLALNEVEENDYEHLHFVLHPASQLKKFHYPILRIIDLCEGNSIDDIDLSEGGANLLIIRRELEIGLNELTAADFAFLTAVKDGNTLAEALEIATHIEPEFDLDAKLSTWIENKTIVDFTL